MFRPSPPRDLRTLPDRFRFGEIAVDVPGFGLRRGDTPLALEPRSFDLLLLLAANRGRVVEKDEIHERLWGEVAVSDNALTRVVAHLRRDLGDDAAKARYIETVRTRGYRFLPALEPLPPRPEGVVAAAPVSAGLEPAHAAAAPAVEVAPVPDATSVEARGRRRRFLPAIAIGAVAVNAIVIALLSAHDPHGRRAAGRVAPVTLRPGAPMLLTLPHGYNGRPSFSPDGRTIAYCSERDGALDIFLHSIADGVELRLTRGGGNVDPAYSPDGRWVAFHSGTRGGIWVVSTLGGEPRQVTSHGSQPAWSPDAREIVYRTLESIAYTGDGWPGTHGTVLAAVTVAGGEVRQLTAPGRPPGGHGEAAWLPDGRRIAFVAGDDTHSGIYLVTADGATLEAVTETAFDKPGPLYWGDPVPLPDGSAILAVAQRRQSSVVLLPLSGDRSATVPILPLAPFGTFSLAVSPDGAQIAYTVPTVDSGIDAVPVDAGGHRTGPPRRLAGDADLRALIPTYSPDGRSMLYLRRHPGAPSDFVALDLATGERRALGRVETPGSQWLHWSWASSSEALFDPWVNGVRIDLETGRRQRTGGLPGFVRIRQRHQPLSNSLRLSPDASTTVFAAQVGTAQELFIWTAGAEEARQLTHLGRVSDFPVWSPDGTRVAFQVLGAGEASNELWLADVPDGEARRLPTEPGLSWAGGFDPSGELVAFAAKRGSRWDVGVVGPTTPERRLGLTAPENSYLRWPAWSPSGSEIAYERTATHADIWVVSLTRSS